MDEFELPREARELLDRAERIETPCGEGAMVWHAWGEGEPVLLLHGGSGSWTHWLRNIPALVLAGRRALVPDLPGFGESAVPPGGGDADAIVAPLADGLMEILGPRPVDVVAFSFGSLVATLLGAQLPQWLDRLLMVGAPVVPLERGRSVDLKPWNRASPAAVRGEVHRHNLKAIMLERDSLIDDFTIALQDINVLRDRMRRRKLVTTTAFQEAVPRLQCPVRALYGERDQLFHGMWPRIEEALAANARYEGLTLVPGSGHWVQFEEAEIFNRWMLEGIA